MTKGTQNVTIVVFDDVTQLDFTGPSQIMSRAPGFTVTLAAALSSVKTDCGWRLLPDSRLDEIERTDVLLVPGGEGVFDMMLDEVFMANVIRLADSATTVASVCTGSFVLAAAGCLRGRRAASHWASESMLAEFGVIPTRGRIVRDGKYVTGGGVTAGIDFSFALVHSLCGDEVARRLQLQFEYDPEPPFPGAGSPAGWPEEIVAQGIAAAQAKRLERVKTAAQALSRNQNVTQKSVAE